MSRTSRSKPIISLRAISGTVRTNTKGPKTLLVVTFDCGFAPSEEPIDGSSIRFPREQAYTVVQLAHTAYAAIGKILAEQQSAIQPA